MSNNIKVHRAVDDATSDIVKEIAISKGLDIINFNNQYRMYKVGEKNNSSTIEVLEKRCVGQGELLLVGGDEFVSLYISGLREWFRTSPIISCNKKGDSIIIETWNSFYELKEEV
jgi:hypothetical protein